MSHRDRLQEPIRSEPNPLLKYGAVAGVAAGFYSISQGNVPSAIKCFSLGAACALVFATDKYIYSPYVWPYVARSLGMMQPVPLSCEYLPEGVELPQSVLEQGWPMEDPITYGEIKEADQVALVRSSANSNIYQPYLKETFVKRFADTLSNEIKEGSGLLEFKNFTNNSGDIFRDVIFVPAGTLKEKLNKAKASFALSR